MALSHWNPLSKDEEDEVHLESLKILSEIGIKVTSQRVISMFKDQGASVDARSQIVRIPENLVKEALSKAPKEFKMCARDKTYDLPLPAKAQVQG